MRTAVVIATTEEPVGVTLFVHDPALSQGSMIAIRDDDDAGIQRLGQFGPFVDRRARRVLESFGLPPMPGPMIMEVEADIEAGTSWQLGTLVAMLLKARGQFEPDPTKAERVLYCTGEVANSSGLIRAVQEVPKKLALSRERIARDALPVVWMFPEDNDPGIETRDDPLLKLAPVGTLDDVLRLVLPDQSLAQPPNPPKSKAKSKTPLFAALALLLATGVGAGAYLWSGPSEPVDVARDQEAQPEQIEPQTDGDTNEADRNTEQAVAVVEPPTVEPEPPRELASLIVEQRIAPGDATQLGASCTALNFTGARTELSQLQRYSVVAADGASDLLPELSLSERLCGFDFSVRASQSGSPLYALLRIAISPPKAATVLQEGAIDGLTKVGETARLSLLPRPNRDLRYRLLAVVGTSPIPSDAGRLLESDETELAARLEADGYGVYILSQQLRRSGS